MNRVFRWRLLGNVELTVNTKLFSVNLIGVCLNKNVEAVSRTPCQLVCLNILWNPHLWESTFVHFLNAKITGIKYVKLKMVAHRCSVIQV